MTNLIEIGPGHIVNTGRIYAPDSRDKRFPLRAALPPRAEVIAPVSRLWRLYRKWQRYQGSTPQCVAYGGKHWELSLPIAFRRGITEAELYALCKQRDDWPGMDGTDSRALLKVYQELGKVASYWWYTGDLEEVKLWVLTTGPIWFGAFWSEEMFFTGSDGVMTVGNPSEYLGHQTLILGYNRRADVWEIVNSHGNCYDPQPCWGDMGRGRMKSVDLQKLLDAQGDACGVCEQLA